VVPEEFKEIDIKGFQPEPKGRKVRREVIYTRTSRDISKYGAFRTLDHSGGVDNLQIRSIAKIQLVPKELERVFGMRDSESHGLDSSGSYMFMDSNMDPFLIAEYRNTQLYHGLNREQEWYDKHRNLTPFKRPKKYPTPSEFWDLEEP